MKKLDFYSGTHSTLGVLAFIVGIFDDKIMLLLGSIILFQVYTHISEK